MKNLQDRSPPLVTPGIAVVASCIIPGLGQMLNRSIQRGLLLLGSTVSIILMLGWRVTLLAHREATALAKLGKAFDRRPFFIGLVISCLVILWVWNVYDAYRQSAKNRPGGFSIFALVLFSFFALGWQISEIDIYKMIREFPDAAKVFSRVWPIPPAVNFPNWTKTTRSCRVHESC